MGKSQTDRKLNQNYRIIQNSFHNFSRNNQIEEQYSSDDYTEQFQQNLKKMDSLMMKPNSKKKNVQRSKPRLIIYEKEKPKVSKTNRNPKTKYKNMHISDDSSDLGAGTSEQDVVEVELEEESPIVALKNKTRKLKKNTDSNLSESDENEDVESWLERKRRTSQSKIPVKKKLVLSPELETDSQFIDSQPKYPQLSQHDEEEEPKRNVKTQQRKRKRRKKYSDIISSDDSEDSDFDDFHPNSNPKKPKRKPVKKVEGKNEFKKILNKKEIKTTSQKKSTVKKKKSSSDVNNSSKIKKSRFLKTSEDENDSDYVEKISARSKAKVQSNTSQEDDDSINKEAPEAAIPFEEEEIREAYEHNGIEEYNDILPQEGFRDDFESDSFPKGFDYDFESDTILHQEPEDKRANDQETDFSVKKVYVSENSVDLLQLIEKAPKKVMKEIDYTSEEPLSVNEPETIISKKRKPKYEYSDDSEDDDFIVGKKIEVLPKSRRKKQKK
eukprot:gene3392-5937_t